MSLEIKNLNIKGEKINLTNINIKLKKGETAAVLGPSGSGKTVLARVLAGFTPENISSQAEKMPDASKNIALVPQDPMRCFSPLLTLKQHLEKTSSNLDEQKQILYRLGLDVSWLQSKPDTIPLPTLSLFTWAFAIFQEPDLIIADNPFSHQDPLMKKRFAYILLTLLKEKKMGLLFFSCTADPFRQGIKKYYLFKENTVIETGPPENPDIHWENRGNKGEKKEILSLGKVSGQHLQETSLRIDAGQELLVLTQDDDACQELGALTAGLLQGKGDMKRNVSPLETLYYQSHPFIPSLTVFHNLCREVKNRTSSYNSQDIFKYFYNSMVNLGWSHPQETLFSFPATLTREKELSLYLLLAALLQPSLVILQHPEGPGCAYHAFESISLLKRSSRDYNTAFFFLTSSPGPYLEQASHIAIFFRGHLLEEGPGEMIRDKPLHPYTKELFNNSPKEVKYPIIAHRTPTNGCPFHPLCPEALPSCGWEGKDLQYFLTELRYNPSQNAEKEEKVINAIASTRLAGTDIAISLSSDTDLVWQDLMDNLQEVMACRQKPMAEACQDMYYHQGELYLSFPRIKPPAIKDLGQRHKVACHFY